MLQGADFIPWTAKPTTIVDNSILPANFQVSGAKVSQAEANVSTWSSGGISQTMIPNHDKTQPNMSSIAAVGSNEVLQHPVLKPVSAPGIRDMIGGSHKDQEQVAAHFSGSREPPVEPSLPITKRLAALVPFQTFRAPPGPMRAQPPEHVHLAKVPEIAQPQKTAVPATRLST